MAFQFQVMDLVLLGLTIVNLIFSIKIYIKLQKHLGEHEGSEQKPAF